MNKKIQKSLRKIILLLIFVGAITIIFLAQYKPSSILASWHDKSFAYRQSISFTHNADISSPRRISIIIDTSTLISNAKMQSDCDDIRFYDKPTGKKLRYQLVSSCNTSTTTFDVEFLTIINGSNTANVYYGNPTATSESTNISSISTLGSSTSTGYLTPGAVSGQWACGYTDVTTSNNVYCTENTNNHAATFSNFGISIPSGATIEGIIVRMEAGSGDISLGDLIQAQLSHNTGTNYTSQQNTGALTTSDDTYTLGSSSDTWGRSWTDTEFSNTNFRVRLTAAMDATSFPTGSKVLLANHTYQTVETLTAGTDILSYDPISKTLVPNKLTSVEKHPKDGYYLINEQVKATDNELIYTRQPDSDQFKWVRVDQIAIGDIILYTDTRQVQEVPVNSLNYYSEQVEVYTVKAQDPYNNYWVDGYLFDPPAGNTVGVDLLEVNVYYSTGPSVTVNTEESSISASLQWMMDEGYGTSLNDSADRFAASTISGALWRTEDLCVSGKCLYFDGSNDVVTSSATVSDVKTVSFWVRPITTTEQFVDINGTASISASSGTISATSFSSPTIYVNGQVSSTLTANRWQHVVVTTATGLSASALKLGQISSNYGQMFMDEFQIYSTQLSANQVKSLYNSRGGNLTAAQFGSNDAKSLSDGLVGYWKMDEASWTGDCSTTSVLDSSGNALNGKSCPNSTAPSPSYGKFGNGVLLDGSDDYLLVDNASNQIANSNGFTLSGWVYPPNNPADHKGYFGMRNDTNGDFYVAQLSGTNTLECRLRNSSGTNYDAANTITPNTWNHVLFTYNEGKVGCYVNGVSGTQISATGTITNTTLGLLIGKSTLGSSELSGRIDEVRLYNKGFTQNEAKSLYNWAAGPIGHWKMDEYAWTNDCATSSVIDYSGYANHAASCPSSTGLSNTTTGMFGKAANFDGVDDHAYISSPSATLENLNEITVSAWVKAETLEQSDNHTIVCKRNGSGASFCLQFGSTNRARPSFGWGSNLGVATGPTDLVVGQWYYITGVRKGSSGNWTGEVYVNGMLAASASSSVDPTGSNPLAIGRLGHGTAQFWDGLIDDVKVYNYARTSSQIIQDMNAGHPLVGTPVAGPVAHWSFDEGYGTTANDQTPNDNDLTLNTASWTNNGKFGKAWNGTGSTWLSRADDSDFDFAGSDEFTISQWIKSDSATNPSTAEMTIAKFETTGTATRGYAIVTNTNGTISFIIDDDNDGSFEAFTTTQDYYDANWHHIIVVKNGTSYVKMYIDGKLIVNTSITDTGSLANNGTVVIGDNNGVDSLYEFNGDIDELKIYRAALSESDVLAEYNQSKSLVLGSLSTESNGTTTSNSAAREYCVPGDTSTCNPPVIQLDMDERTGTTAYDKSGNGYNATLYNTATWSTGKIGGSLLLDAAETGNGDTHARFADNILDSLTEGTVSLWFKAPASFAGNRTLFAVTEDDNNGFSDYFSLSYNVGNNIRLYISNNGTEVVQAEYTLTSRTTDWHHLSFTTNSSGHAIYLDGQRLTLTYTTGSASVATWIDDISENLTAYTIGGFNADGSDTNDIFSGSGFPGYIDRFLVYNYARTPAQIAWDYNKGKPIAHWQFDETSGTTAYDNSGNNLNGTLTNSPTRTTSGKLNSAIEFNGSTNYITTSDINQAENTPSLSVAAWVKPNALSANRCIICKFNNDGTQTVWGLSTGASFSSKVAFLASSSLTDLNTGEETTGWQLAVGSWAHIAATFDGTLSGYNKLNIYVNGNTGLLETSTGGALPSTLLDGSSAITIGSASDASRFFNGTIDDVRIYNYALTANQVKLIMNDGAAVKF